MADAPMPCLPSWVSKRDGRLVPFEADKISRALFAATECLGRPDAFLARELTDGVAHFLAAEFDGATPTTTQIRDLVIKVVRELGQPTLAEAFAGPAPKPARKMEGVSEPAGEAAGPLAEVSLAGSPAAFTGACLRVYSLRRVFARDLAAAHGDGLLTLTGLESPHTLAGCVVSPARGEGSLTEAILDAGSLAGGFLVFDGPEHFLARAAPADDRAVAEFVRELALALRAVGLPAVVNLNSAAPPSWAGDLAEGPLFARQQQSPDPAELARCADALLEALPPSSPSRVRIDWHLGERDFAPAASDRLLRLARLAVQGDGPAFTFDRPRRPVLLAEGVDRHHPAALLTVGLNLSALAAQPGIEGDPERFLPKLGSLARLALSAAVQKRDFLRRHCEDRPGVVRGFLLDRARLLAAPIGLEAVARAFTGRGLCEGKPALEFARQVVLRLRDVLRQDGRNSLLDTCLDAPPLGCRLAIAEEEGSAIEQQMQPAHRAAGVMPWDVRAEVKDQLRAAGALHATVEMGTATIFLPDKPSAAEDAAGWLRSAWQQTDVARIRFERASAVPRQLTLEGQESALRE